LNDNECPYCDFKLSASLEPRDRGRAEVAHMNEAHPKIIERRMLDAGFVRGADGEWVDTLADPLN
jgi:hypothetical protein